MFKHILVPTDGSKLAAKGIKLGQDSGGSDAIDRSIFRE